MCRCLILATNFRILLLISLTENFKTKLLRHPFFILLTHLGLTDHKNLAKLYFYELHYPASGCTCFKWHTVIFLDSVITYLLPWCMLVLLSLLATVVAILFSVISSPKIVCVSLLHLLTLTVFDVLLQKQQSFKVLAHVWWHRDLFYEGNHCLP
jgi:hypothetical protein